MRASRTFDAQQMTYEPCARLRVTEQQNRDAKERRGDLEGFEGYADDPCGEETHCKGNHERSPACEVLRAAGRSSTFLTDVACHRPPRAVATPRAFSASATSRRVLAPAFCASLMIGSTLAAYLSALVLITTWAASRASGSLGPPRTLP